MLDTIGQIQHLLKLLDDRSPEIQKIVRRSLLENSLELILKRPFYRLRTENELRSILDTLFEELHAQMVLSAFQELLKKNLEDIDLEKAVLLLAYWNNPQLDIPAFIQRLNRIAGEIESGLPMSGHPLGFVDHINGILFKKYRFRGNTRDYYNPDNSFIDRVVETRKGIPITLSVLYLLIARRLGIPVVGVPMPAHFIVKMDNGSDEIFFDPFYSGKIYSRQECLGYLENANLMKSMGILDGCPDYEIVMRMMRNIHLVYSSYKDEPEKVTAVEDYLKLLEKHFL